MVTSQFFDNHDLPPMIISIAGVMGGDRGGFRKSEQPICMRFDFFRRGPYVLLNESMHADNACGPSVLRFQRREDSWCRPA